MARDVRRWRLTTPRADHELPSRAELPQLVAGVAWIDHTRTSVMLYPGLQEPSVAMPARGPMEVPRQLRPTVVATFNSGFKLSDSGGGFAYNGHTYAALKAGLATILRYRDGRVDVISWTGGPDVPGDVVYARQNLPLIVSGGRPNPNLSDGPEWGATLGNAIQVWRSAVGIDRHGNLIYAAAELPDGGFAGRDHDPRRGGPRDGARHQHVLDELHHLPVSGRRGPREPPPRHGPLARALPDPG